MKNQFKQICKREAKHNSKIDYNLFVIFVLKTASMYGGRQPPSRKNFFLDSESFFSMMKNREKTYRIEKKFQNPQKYFTVKKNMKSRKKLGNRGKKIKSRNQENISESRQICQKKLFQNQEMFCYENCEKIFGIECFYNIFA